MANVMLPAGNVTSAVLPVGDLDVYSRSWLLQVAEVGAVATFVLPTGGALTVTFGGTDPPTRTIAGSSTAIWMTGVDSQELLPPLEPVAAPGGGLPLPP